MISATRNLLLAIDTRYLLKRNGRDWLLPDGGVVRMTNRHSIGFSLDNPKFPPFRFLGSNPPRHIGRICDAILVASRASRLYVGILEQKSGHKDDSRRQLVNGRLFCDWIFGLFRANGYSVGELVYVRILTWTPSGIPNKGTTTPGYGVKKSTGEHFDWTVDVRNENCVFFAQILEEVESLEA